MLIHSVYLAFFSAIIFLAGVQRSQIYVYFISAGRVLSFPPAPLLLGGLLEVTIGIIGLALSAAVAIGFKLRANLMPVVLLLVTVFQWYIFLLFIFILPGVEASKVVGTPEPFESQAVWNTFVASGIMASAFYCATLLGGQWVALLAMYKRLPPTSSFFRRLAICWSVAILLTGVFILVAGICATTVDPGPHRIAAPPIFIIHSGIAIATGCLAMAVGGFGTYVSTSSSPVPFLIHSMALCGMLNFLWQIAVMSLYQPPAQGNFVAATPTAGLIVSQLAAVFFFYLWLKLNKGTDSEDVDIEGMVASSATPL